MRKVLRTRWIGVGQSEVAARPDQPVDCAYFDGETATRHSVRVAAFANYLAMTRLDPPGAAIIWRLEQVRAIAGGKDRAMALTLTLLADTEDERPRDPARLVIPSGDFADWVRGAAPGLMQRDVRSGTGVRVALRVGAALLAIGAIVFVLLPRIADTLAMRMPIEREVAFGAAVERQMEWLLGGQDGTLTCSDPQGLAALAVLQRRLTEGQNLQYKLTLRVLDHDMVNAFAVPGGQIVVLRGLLDGAETPAEVAGVIAHEIGHVEARDPTRLAFRAAGSAGIISLLLGDATGGTLMAVMGDHMLSASYTREAEAAADGFAHRLLTATEIGTEGMATFFDRIEGMGVELPEYLATHPASKGRAALARAADQGAGRAIMSDTQWQALRAICD
jgi:beta-barrel assembly-enhancing protease